MGDNGNVAIYSTPDQLALLLASIVQILDHEPDSSYEDAEVRGVARHLAGTIHERLAATVESTTRPPQREQYPWPPRSS